MRPVEPSRSLSIRSRAHRPLDHLTVFAVTDTTAQLTWRSSIEGDIEVGWGPTGQRHAAGATFPGDGGPSAMTIGELSPGTVQEVTVAGGGPTRTFRTLPAPPGRELFRFATISDLHLGETTFGYFGTMREDPQPLVAYPVRATRAALDEIGRWGAELIVVKGDCTNDGRVEEWETFGKLMADAGLPYDVIPGNHDARPLDREPSPIGRFRHLATGGAIARLLHGPAPTKGRAVTPEEGLRSIGHEPPDPINVRDVDGLRIVLVDTTLEGRHVGTLAGAADAVVDAAADARRDGRAVFVAAHHYPMPRSVPHFWPPGVPANDVGSLFGRLAAANPAAFYSAGHTHRHRRYDRDGVCCTEVGSPKDHPGTWAGYIVYETGITQVVWRVAAPDVLAWTEPSRRAALGLWGRWSPGRLADRCFHHRWPT